MMRVKMPALPGAKSYTIANVLVKPGDVVTKGQELFNVETSKRAVSVCAREDGTVARVLVGEGDQVNPNDVLAEIAGEPAGESADAPAGSKAANNASAMATTTTTNEIAAEAADASIGTAASAKNVTSTAAAMADESAATDSTEHAELLVIGGGMGGYVAAIYAAKLGKHVTLIERAELGGTCLNRGCIPTKTLISSALLRRSIARASEWGIEVAGDVRPRMDAIIQRKNQVVEQLRQGVAYLMEKNRIQVIAGHARFLNNATVSVEADCTWTFTFDDCIIATGSAVKNLSVPGADLPEVMNTDEALDLATLPSSIVVVGGGVTGAEFAFMYSNLGVRVTLIARRPRLLHMFDEDASAALLQSARAHGISVLLQGDVQGFARQESGLIETSVLVGGSPCYLASERVLVAGGRMPVTNGLGLENTDVAVNPRSYAIDVDGHMRTSVPHIYAVGDVNDLVMLAHAASYQGRIAVDDMRGKIAAFESALVPRVAYTDPEVATVGIGADEARKDAASYTVGTFSLSSNGKALAENAAEGYVSLVTDSDGVVIGATIVSAHASELIGQIGLAVSAGLSGDDVRSAIFAHPTTSETIHEAAFDLTLGALHE